MAPSREDAEQRGAAATRPAPVLLRQRPVKQTSWAFAIVVALASALLLATTTVATATPVAPADDSLSYSPATHKQQAVLALPGKMQFAASQYAQWAALGISALQQWYDYGDGLYDYIGWWNNANALHTYISYVQYNASLQKDALTVLETTFTVAQNATLINMGLWDPTLKAEIYKGHGPNTGQDPMLVSFPDFINDFYDDEGWWAMAWVAAYDLTGNSTYLSMAQTIFQDMTGGWASGTCGGGVWWNKAQSGINAVENEIFIKVAAQLANRVPTYKSYYLQWAQRGWQWFYASGMINSQGNVNDGINITTCQNNHGIVWSYNQGTILGALVELDKASPDPKYMQVAHEIAHGALQALTDQNGIVHDPCEPNCGQDGPTFKGIFARNLHELTSYSPQAAYVQAMQKNAQSIWSTDRNSASELGLVWSGPLYNITAATTASGLDMIIGAALFPNDPNTYGNASTSSTSTTSTSSTFSTTTTTSSTTTSSTSSTTSTTTSTTSSSSSSSSSSSTTKSTTSSSSSSSSSTSGTKSAAKRSLPTTTPAPLTAPSRKRGLEYTAGNGDAKGQEEPVLQYRLRRRRFSSR